MDGIGAEIGTRRNGIDGIATCCQTQHRAEIEVDLGSFHGILSSREKRLQLGKKPPKIA